MGKTFALILVAIALVSTGIFISHHWWFPEVASSHGEAMNHQFTETFVGAGIGFVLAQMGLAAFVWQFGEKKGQGRRVRTFPGGARGLIILAFIYVGCEILLLEVVGTKVWAAMYFTSPPSDAQKI